MRCALAGLVLLFFLPPLAAADPAALDSIAQTLSPDFAAAERRRDFLLGLEPQPRPMSARCNTLGYHSRAAASAQSIRWVQVDLGDVQPVDYVVLIPAVGPGGEESPGYYFPPRFHVELSDSPVFGTSTTVAEMAVDGAATRPVIVSASGQKARYVRVTATHLSGRDGKYFFAFGELLVLSGNRNLAAERPVTAPDSIENPPLWGTRYLVDGQGMVGPPLSSLQGVSNGYHSAIGPSPDAVKWVQIDLGADQKLDEVRLVPARSSDFPDIGGFGFPKRFKVEVAARPEFDSPTVLLDATGADYPNPGDGLVVIPGRGASGRYVRVTATRLWERTGEYLFALAELQVYAQGNNVARDKPVTALDSLDRGLWGKQYLVDGFASQYQLIEWPQWVAFEQEWQEWTANMTAATALLETARLRAYDRMARASVAIVLLSLLLGLGLAWRVRGVRSRKAAALCERMARELHSEVGSNLGSILLLAETGDAKDLREIARVAGQSAATLGDLVWLKGSKTETTAHFVAKLREIAAVMLVGLDHAVEAPADRGSDRISPAAKRHLYLAFKEILANVVLHAHASRVHIRLYRDGRWLILEVRDDGVGFEPSAATSGSGLRDLRARAAAFRGEVELHTAPGKGTQVRLIARL